MAEPVAKHDPLGLVDNRLGEVGGNEDHPFALGQDDIAGQHGHVSDADGRVEPHEHHVPDGRRIPSPDERVEALDLGQTLEVADRAVENDAVAGLGEDGVAEVVADQGPVVDLAEAVGDIHITRLESVDGPGVHGPDTAFLVAAVEHALGQLGARGHVLSREGAADHGHVVVNRFPVALELGLVAVRAQITPCLFDRDLPHPSEDLIGDLGTAVGESLPFPFGREEDQLLAGDGLSRNGVAETQDEAGHERRGQQHDAPPSPVVGRCGLGCLEHVEHLLRTVIAGRRFQSVIWRLLAERHRVPPHPIPRPAGSDFSGAIDFLRSRCRRPERGGAGRSPAFSIWGSMALRI